MSEETEVYLVITEDRHTDVEVEIFFDEDRAIEVAQSFVDEYDDEGVEQEELTEEMRNDGWIWYRVYSCEGDCIRVVKTTIQ